MSKPAGKARFYRGPDPGARKPRGTSRGLKFTQTSYFGSGTLGTREQGGVDAPNRESAQARKKISKQRAKREESRIAKIMTLDKKSRDSARERAIRRVRKRFERGEISEEVMREKISHIQASYEEAERRLAARKNQK